MSIVLREVPQERALITVAILRRLFRTAERSDIDLAEGMSRAAELVARNPDARRDYEVLVRIFREAQARDAEWCAHRVDRLADAVYGEGCEGGLAAFMLRQEASLIRAHEGEMDDAEWPVWVRTMREAAAECEPPRRARSAVELRGRG